MYAYFSRQNDNPFSLPVSSYLSHRTAHSHAFTNTHAWSTQRTCTVPAYTYLIKYLHLLVHYSRLILEEETTGEVSRSFVYIGWVRVKRRRGKGQDCHCLGTVTGFMDLCASEGRLQNSLRVCVCVCVCLWWGCAGWRWWKQTPRQSPLTLLQWLFISHSLAKAVHKTNTSLQKLHKIFQTQLTHSKRIAFERCFILKRVLHNAANH